MLPMCLGYLPIKLFLPHRFHFWVMLCICAISISIMTIIYHFQLKSSRPILRKLLRLDDGGRSDDELSPMSN